MFIMITSIVIILLSSSIVYADDEDGDGGSSSSANPPLSISPTLAPSPGSSSAHYLRRYNQDPYHLHPVILNTSPSPTPVTSTPFPSLSPTATATPTSTPATPTPSPAQSSSQTSQPTPTAIPFVTGVVGTVNQQENHQSTPSPSPTKTPSPTPVKKVLSSKTRIPVIQKITHSADSVIQAPLNLIAHAVAENVYPSQGMNHSDFAFFLITAILCIASGTYVLVERHRKTKVG